MRIRRTFLPTFKLIGKKRLCLSIKMNKRYADSVIVILTRSMLLIESNGKRYSSQNRLCYQNKTVNF